MMCCVRAPQVDDGVSDVPSVYAGMRRRHPHTVTKANAARLQLQRSQKAARDEREAQEAVKRKARLEQYEREMDAKYTAGR